MERLRRMWSGRPEDAGHRSAVLRMMWAQSMEFSELNVEYGYRRPVKDLVAPGRFLLIAGEDGQAWCEAARQLAAEAGLPLDAVRTGHLDGDLYDPRCTWLRHRQIASDGAILVRPGEHRHRPVAPGPFGPKNLGPNERGREPRERPAQYLT